MALDSSSPDWADQVLEATDGKGVDLIVDQVSGGVMNDNLKTRRSSGGSIMSAGSTALRANLIRSPCARRIDYISIIPDAERGRSRGDYRCDENRSLGRRRVGRVADPNRCVSLEQAGEAHQYMKDNQHWEDLTDGLNVARDGAGRAQQSIVPGPSVLR